MSAYTKALIITGLAAVLGGFLQMKSLHPFIGEPPTFVLVMSGLAVFLFRSARSVSGYSGGSHSPAGSEPEKIQSAGGRNGALDPAARARAAR
jgi:hypothetical protein